jgi:hypothetical protein
MKASSSSKPAQEMPKDRPSKPSHIEMGRSVWKQKYLQTMKKLGYFSSKVNVQLPAEQTIPTLKNADIIVYRSFFKAGLRLPMFQLIGKILEKYEIFMHHLTPNAIVRLGTFIWALRSQGGRAKADVFCRIHELHYQMKARANKLHNNFGCYNFIYCKDEVAPVLAYQTKCHGDWTKEWFYVEVDSETRQEFKSMLMSLLRISFGVKRPKCNMNKVAETCYNTFKTVVEKVGTRDLIQGALAYNILPTCTEWKLTKQVKSKDGEPITLDFKFKEQSSYKAPFEGWLKPTK